MPRKTCIHEYTLVHKYLVGVVVLKYCKKLIVAIITVMVSINTTGNVIYRHQSFPKIRYH